MDEKVKTKIHWDIGTAYDLFISLRILHEPERYSVRASWAAGVRSRVPVEYRPTLEEAAQIVSVPLKFIHSLNPPKNSAELLARLKTIPPRKVL
ncbi:MAG: hypothetical protein PHT43_02360, partial [Anaerolineaceae bacterium]|nr:hypothetical protein [Anaerolineaceae bacterium]